MTRMRRGELERVKDRIKEGLRARIRDGDKLEALRIATERRENIDSLMPVKYREWWKAQRAEYASWIRQQIWEELIWEMTKEKKRRAS